MPTPSKMEEWANNNATRGMWYNGGYENTRHYIWKCKMKAVPFYISTLYKSLRITIYEPCLLSSVKWLDARSVK